MDGITTAIAFEDAHLGTRLQACDAAELDALDFGLIGFDESGRVRRYNRYEAVAAGLSHERVIGHSLFDEVAPCMNNFMVAERFAHARRSGEALDATIDYVLTLRMKPTRVALRLIAAPGAAMAYVLVRRRAVAS